MSTKSNRRKKNRAWMSELVARTQQEPDRLLLTFVNMANAGASTDITIDVGGSVYSGTLIGATDYAKRVSDRMNAGLKKAFPTHTFPPLFDAIAQNAETFATGFAHLDNVRRWADSGQHTPLNGGLLRVRLSEVRGWMPGSVTTERA